MPNPVTVVARMYEHIEPMDRGERYEDPLNAALQDVGLGEVTGGGSQLTETGEIAFGDVEIEVTSLDDALPVIIKSLQSSGAPVGSEIHGDDGVIRRFGERQSVAVYLDGVSLPAEVYEQLDFQEMLDALTSAAGDDSYHGYWQGPEETGLFFFGPDAEVMFTNVERTLKAMPIGQNARVVVRPSQDAASHRTVRMPRR